MLQKTSIVPLFLFFLGAFSVGPVFAEPVIWVEAVQQPAWVERAGQRKQLDVNDVVLSNDRISTDRGGRVNLRFGRHGVIDLGARSETRFKTVPFASYAADLKTVISHRSGSLRIVWKHPQISTSWPVFVDVGPIEASLTVGEFFFDVPGVSAPAFCVADGQMAVSFANSDVQTLRGSKCYRSDPGGRFAGDLMNEAEAVARRQAMRVGASITVASNNLKQVETPDSLPAVEPAVEGGRLPVGRGPIPQATPGVPNLAGTRPIVEEGPLPIIVPPPGQTLDPLVPVSKEPPKIALSSIPEEEAQRNFTPPPPAPELKEKFIPAPLKENFALPVKPRPVLPAEQLTALPTLAQLEAEAIEKKQAKKLQLPKKAPPRKVQVAKPKSPAPKRLARSGTGAWALNVGSFQSLEVAQGEVRRLEDKGYRPRIRQADVKDKTWYRVQIDGFDSLSEARSWAGRLAAEAGVKNAWVVKP